MRRLAAPLVLTLALAVGLAGCGDDGDEATTSSTTTAEGSTSTTEGSSSTTQASGDSSSTTTEDGSASSAPVPDADLPGEPIEIFPDEGAELAVVGVAADDTLNVRSGPSTDFEVVAELGPLSTEATATGQNRTVGDSLWAELEADGVTGWANTAYLAQAGATTDVTADLPATQAETMLAVAEAVAAARAGEGEGPEPRITVVDGPSVGDLGEVAVDVVGLADDALKGERLRIFARPDPSGEGFTVTSVEATALCARGVTGDGLCV